MALGRESRLPDVFSVAWPAAIAVAGAWTVLLVAGADARGLLTGGAALMPATAGLTAAHATAQMPVMTRGGAAMSMLGIGIAPGEGVLSVPVFGGFCWMWAVMVVAMMLPVGLPSLLRRGIEPPPGFVVASLLPWVLLAVPAYGLLVGLQLAFPQPGGRALRLAAVLVLACAGYELTGPKRNCRLRCCELENGSSWTDGLRLGAASVGCCGPMMGALVLIAMMNVVWMAAFCVVMVAERSLRWGPWLARLAASGLAVGAVVVLAAAHHLPALV